MKTRLVLLVLLITLLGYKLRRTLLARWLGVPRPRFRVKIQRDIAIPMSDGVHLRADHYYPDTNENCPTILIRSPYGRSTKAGFFGLLVEFCASRFAEQGYHVLTQDTRGRFDSEGRFEPFFHDRDDGLATLAWLQQQTWFNGVVGMWGPSYLGIVQWQIADAAPIKALVPVITSSRLYDIVFPDGVLDLGLMMRWIALLKALDRRRSLMLGALMLWEVESEVKPAFNYLPLMEVDKALKNGSVDYFREWLENAAHNPEWRQKLNAIDHRQVNAPVHLIGGWYDFFLRGLLNDYFALKAAGKNPYLTIGPWYHFSHMFLMVKMVQPGIEWFDIHLKGQREKLRHQPVRLYVMGAKQWCEFAEYPPPSQPKRLYLTDEQRLSEAISDSSPDGYAYDPAQPFPMWGGAQFYIRGGPRDNRRLEQRPDVLVYSTPPLQEPLEVIGAVKLELYVQSTLAHTDFYGRLCDVYPSGKSINICDGLFRIEPGKGEPQPDGTLRIEIDMWATALRFSRGHRIRLLIASSAHPRWSRHTGGSDPLTDTTLRIAQQTIFHDSAHPSALILPVISPLSAHT